MMKTLRKQVRPIMIVIVIIFAASIFFTYGADRGRGGSATASDAASGDAGGDRDVAVVNGERIKLSRIDTEVVQYISEMGLDWNAISADLPSLRNMIIDRIATLKELDKEVASRRLTVTKEELDEAVKEVEAQFPTKEIYLQQLKSAGLTEESFRKNIDDNMKRSKLFEEVTSIVSVDEAELRGRYDTFKSYAYQKPEGFLMDVAHFSTQAAAEAAKKELEAGKKWDDVMASASADVTDHSPSDERMFIPSEQLTWDVEFLKALSMDVPSQVVPFTSDDHMIVVKRSNEEAGTASFDEVRDIVQQEMLNEKRTSIRTQFMQSLRAKAKVEILDQKLFSALAQAPAGAAGGDDDKPVSADAPAAALSADDKPAASDDEAPIASGDKSAETAASDDKAQ